MRKSILWSVALVFMVSCGGTQYRDAAKDKGSREWGPKEIKMTVNTMVGSLYTFLKDEWKKPAFIEVKKFRNKTSEHIDTKMISDEISTNLIKKRIRFIDRSLTEDALKEMEMGMTGLIDPDSAIPVGMLKSPNFYLTGDIRDNVRTVGGKSLQYVVVTMQLVELKTGMVAWQDRQEFLKATSKGKISF
ncbi:MAG TPA: penicillin-binding protein activator LpoB [Spirochaetes bacterium]|nr:penicillin-binding protein activator LpoB [Spirochaetota bacterium]